MSCKHIHHNAHESKDVHVLPCRHKLCIGCACAVPGLMTGDIFSCPICGNFSQYVDPQDKVFGDGKQAGHVGIEDRANHHRTEPPAVGVPADSSIRTNAAESELYTKLENDGITMTEEDRRAAARTMFQQRERLAAIQMENEAKKLNARRHADSSTRQVENLAESVKDKAKIDSPKSFDDEHVLKLRNDFYPEDCPIHKESTTFLCVNCVLKLCAQCGSEHILSYQGHRIEDMSAFSTSDRNDGDYAGNASVSSTEPTAKAETTKQCVEHQYPFILYCKKCQALLCRECKVIHPNHYASWPVPLREMMKEVYTKFNRYFDEINSEKGKYKEASEKAEVKIQKVKGQADELKQKVNTATQQAIEQIRENAEVMIRQIDSEAEKVTANHKAQAESVKKNIETLDKVESLVQNALKNADESEFLVAEYAEGEIATHMKSLDANCLYPKYGSSETIFLECQVNKRLAYLERDGDRSCAPVRLANSQFSSRTYASADSIWFQRM